MNWTPTWILQSRYENVEDIEGEIWKHFTMWRNKELKPYYWISNYGRLRSEYRGIKRILPGTSDPSTGGYIHTFVRTRDNSQVHLDYHQAVARYFLGDPPTDLVSPCVDHIDSNILDNRVSNLQWLSASENSKKGYKDGRYSIFAVNGGWNKQKCHFEQYPEIIFNSLKEAAQFIHRNPDYVAECLRLGRRIIDKRNGTYVDIIIEEESLDVRLKYRTACGCEQHIQ